MDTSTTISTPTATDGAAPPGSSPAPPVARGVADPLGPTDPAAHATLSAWEDCDDGFECAALTVPRRWSDVDGDTMELAVVRHAARGDRGDRIGSLIVNPGGPGASGVEFVEGFVTGQMPDGLDERFDIVGWDPRGTGRSEKIDCTTDEQWLKPDLDPTPDDPGEVEALRAQASEDAEACLREEGELLQLVGTRATVRDLDALRGALGDPQLTYVGYSYGTTIGMEYLRLYPGRVRAMVLDGVAVPGADPVEDALAQAIGFERTLDAYLDDCANRSGCPLGDDPKATLLDLAVRLDDTPVPADYTLAGTDAVARVGEVGTGELYIAVASSLYRRESWPTLDQGLAEALAPEPSGRTLLALRDDYLGRQADGTWDDNADSRRAIRCADQEARSTRPEGDTSLVEPWSNLLPFWGAWFAVGTPGCWGLPEAVEPLASLSADELGGAPPVVVIGTTNDPATPYEQSVAATQIIEGSVLVTYVGDQHTIYRSRSACIDEPVTRYLTTGDPPADGLRCTG